MTASTGMAAYQLQEEKGTWSRLYVKGPSTLHSAASLPISEMPDTTSRIELGKAKLRNMPVVVVDEVSMVDRRTLEQFLSRVSPGTGILAVGDFFQLPPVQRSPDGRPDYAFTSPAFRDFKLIELETVYRQCEPEFVDFLTDLRHGRIDDNVLTGLCRPFDPKHPVLFGTNAEADQLNAKATGGLAGSAIRSEAQLHGGHPDKAMAWLERSTRARKILDLKKEMRVLCIQNHDGLINGDIGTVIGISTTFSHETHLPTWVRVSFDRRGVGEKTIFPFRFEKRIWNARTQEEEVQLSVLQYPIVPAYGLSVHKSQGMSLDVVNVCGTRINFAPGHVYVALSRARTIKGIHLQEAHGLDAFYDSRVLAYYENATRFEKPIPRGTQQLK